MKHILRKTETRKFVLFASFVVLVFVVMAMDAKAGKHGNTVTTAVEIISN